MFQKRLDLFMFIHTMWFGTYRVNFNSSLNGHYEVVNSFCTNTWQSDIIYCCFSIPKTSSRRFWSPPTLSSSQSIRTYMLLQSANRPHICYNAETRNHRWVYRIYQYIKMGGFNAQRKLLEWNIHFERIFFHFEKLMRLCVLCL